VECKFIVNFVNWFVRRWKSENYIAEQMFCDKQMSVGGGMMGIGYKAFDQINKDLDKGMEE